jgi:PAS domain S-box-containing protein
MVADPSGLVVAASRPEWVGRAIVESAPGGLAERDACLDDPGPLPSTTPLVTCSYPIRALFDETKVIGTLSASWDLGRLFRQMQLDRAFAPKEGELLLLRRDGLVVSAPESRRDWVLRRNLRESGWEAARLAGSGRGGYLVERLGEARYLVGYARSSGASGWSALVAQDVGTAFAPVHRLRAIVLGVGVAVAILSVGVSVFLAGRTTKPLVALASAAERVAGGDLEVRVHPGSADEIGSLAATFDRMVQDLKRQRTQLVDKEYVDSLIASMSDGLFVVDAQGVVQRANRAFLQLLGAPSEEIVGRSASAIFVEGPEAFRTRVVEPARERGSVHEVELAVAPRSGEPVPVLLSAGVLPADRDDAHIVCIATDITHHRRMEQELVQAREGAEAAAKAKAQFLAVVSHEVRTPLNGVLGMTELLAGTHLTDQQREYVTTARRSGEALLAILSDILDFSKGDAGKLELERVEFDLRSCLESAADILSLRAREKGIELGHFADERLPARVVGDPWRLGQVLLNLGSNAVKFTPRGGVVIRAEPDRASSSRVRVSIRDTGIGIAEERLDRLFKPFSQVDSSTTRRYGGTGLGLAIAKQLVELMHGEIGVETEQGKGSTFWFTTELPAAEERGPAPLPPEALRGLRALIVDDNETNRLVLREMLRTWGCQTDEAADAWEGLDKLREAAGTPRAFQVALIDFQMPEMDGEQLAQEIKRDPQLAHIPLVLLTSMPQHGDAARSLGLGFAASLIKPVRQAVLRDTLLSVLGAEAPRRGARLSLVVGASAARAGDEAPRSREPGAPEDPTRS